jgi:hypothetical protein
MQHTHATKRERERPEAVLKGLIQIQRIRHPGKAKPGRAAQRALVFTGLYRPNPHKPVVLWPPWRHFAPVQPQPVSVAGT